MVIKVKSSLSCFINETLLIKWSKYLVELWMPFCVFCNRVTLPFLEVNSLITFFFFFGFGYPLSWYTVYVRMCVWFLTCLLGYNSEVSSIQGVFCLFCWQETYTEIAGMQRFGAFYMDYLYTMENTSGKGTGFFHICFSLNNRNKFCVRIN